MIIKFLHFLLSKMKVCNSRYVRKIRDKSTNKAYVSVWIRFFLETFFELCICTFVTVVPGENGGLFDLDEWIPGDYFTFHYTWILIACLSAFFAISTYFIFTKIDRLSKQNENDIRYNYSQDLIEVLQLA